MRNRSLKVSRALLLLILAFKPRPSDVYRTPPKKIHNLSAVASPCSPELVPALIPGSEIVSNYKARVEWLSTLIRPLKNR